MREYEAQVERTVLAYRDHPGLLGWSLGNEVWGLLKHHYGQPYLTRVRHAHVAFVERLARRIKALDPKHPVLTVHEHSNQLPGALADFARGAPSLDAIGVNSYYRERTEELASVTARFDPGRPYLVTEFGPDGYWHDRFTPHTPAGAIVEATAVEKARLYERNWAEYVAGFRGRNVGGIAYCWSDRYEGTTSWFGMTDWFGRPKPAYYAMRRAWTGRPAETGPVIRGVVAPARAAPGETVEIRADVASDERPECAWAVTGKNFAPDVAVVEPGSEPGVGRVTLPRRPGTYRVHLQVRTTRGLDEANVPIVVEAAPSPPTVATDGH